MPPLLLWRALQPGRALTRGAARLTMERLSQLEPRTSVLEDDFDEEALEAEGKAAAAAAVPACPLFAAALQGVG